METKIIPFDLETAKKIQAGEIKGKIKTKGGFNVRIVSFDMDNESYQIVALVRDTVVKNQEYSMNYTKDGYIYSSVIHAMNDLVLEVPDNEPQFKPFDKVLVKDEEFGWIPTLYSFFTHNATHMTINGEWDECLPYEGNQDLVGTTKTPKDYGGK